MRKVGILTWYKAINHGAVLQTYASCKMLENLACTPVVLDYNWNLSEANKKNILDIIKKMSIRKLLWKSKVKKCFSEKKDIFSLFCKNYLPLGKDYLHEENLDAVYIGSDMVFDLSEGYNPYMYGINVPSNYIFSYAASFGYTTLDSFKNHPHFEVVKNAICDMNQIGYRDQNTKEICMYCGTKAKMVENVDPVLAYGFEKEITSWDNSKWKDKNYLLIYAYESTMNDETEVNTIKKIAKTEGLEIISCGYYHKWCDTCINADPKEFVEMIKHAKYVITDTFHGTVFSLLMHKKLCVIVRKNGFKIEHLLNSCELGNIIARTPDQISNVLQMDVDYDDFDNWRNKESVKSLNYIKENIDRAMEK